MQEESFSTLEALLQQPVFHYFSELCQIPHPSFKEKAISDFVYQWAKEKSFFHLAGCLA